MCSDDCGLECRGRSSLATAKSGEEGIQVFGGLARMAWSNGWCSNQCLRDARDAAAYRWANARPAVGMAFSCGSHGRRRCWFVEQRAVRSSRPVAVEPVSQDSSMQTQWIPRIYEVLLHTEYGMCCVWLSCSHAVCAHHWPCRQYSTAQH